MDSAVPAASLRQLSACSEPYAREDIARVALFDGVPLAGVWGILERCPYYELNDNQTLISPVDSTRRLYLILHGACSVHLESRSSEPVATIGAGSSVGELSIIDDSPPSAFVIARGGCRVLAIGPEEFWALLDISREIAINLLALLAQRIRGNNATVSQSRRLQKEYKRHASVDGLTGVHNRRRLDELLPRYLGRADQGSGALCLIMTDIDHFKNFNDTYGHSTGDDVLLKVAQVLETRSRPTDFVARYGGEEFTVVLPTTQSEQALMVAERLRSSVEQLELTQKDGTRLGPLTISLGIAQALPGESPQSLIERADKALYAAKKSGRNRSVLAPAKEPGVNAG
ncbi:MAG: hypothetical protein RJA70_3944 [Pseudomonadota bacterium]|jgi:diguanylate cyclase (GGDEF)-like protein